jgi:hypothetical protein
MASLTSSPTIPIVVASPTTSAVSRNFSDFIKRLDSLHVETLIREAYTNKLTDLIRDLKLGAELIPEGIVKIFAQARDLRLSFLSKVIPYIENERGIREALIKAFPTALTILQELNTVSDESRFKIWEEHVKEYVRVNPSFPVEELKPAIQNRQQFVPFLSTYTMALNEISGALRNLE